QDQPNMLHYVACIMADLQNIKLLLDNKKNPRLTANFLSLIQHKSWQKTQAAFGSFQLSSNLLKMGFETSIHRFLHAFALRKFLNIRVDFPAVMPLFAVGVATLLHNIITQLVKVVHLCCPNQNTLTVSIVIEADLFYLEITGKRRNRDSEKPFGHQQHHAYMAGVYRKIEKLGGILIPTDAANQHVLGFRLICPLQNQQLILVPPGQAGPCIYLPKEAKMDPNSIGNLYHIDEHYEYSKNNQREIMMESLYHCFYAIDILANHYGHADIETLVQVIISKGIPYPEDFNTMINNRKLGRKARHEAVLPVYRALENNLKALLKNKLKGSGTGVQILLGKDPLPCNVQQAKIIFKLAMSSSDWMIEQLDKDHILTLSFELSPDRFDMLIFGESALRPLQPYQGACELPTDIMHRLMYIAAELGGKLSFEQMETAFPLIRISVARNEKTGKLKSA
ncbi:MAG: hypothetical protein V3U02_02090, partial [Calditrichia bacterium]